MRSSGARVSGGLGASRRRRVTYAAEEGSRSSEGRGVLQPLLDAGHFHRRELQDRRDRRQQLLQN